MILMTFKNAVALKVLVLNESVKRKCREHTLWEISGSVVGSFERSHKYFAETPMSWFAASSKAMTPYNFLVTSCRSSFSI